MCTVFCRMGTGVVGSDPVWGMDVFRLCLCFTVLTEALCQAHPLYKEYYQMYINRILKPGSDRPGTMLPSKYYSVEWKD